MHLQSDMEKLIIKVLMGPRDENQTYIDFVLDHLPWLTGSLGTVFLDLTVRQCRNYIKWIIFHENSYMNLDSSSMSVFEYIQ